MNAGILKQIKRDIKAYEDELTAHQDEMTQEEIDEILDYLGKLYDLKNIFE